MKVESNENFGTASSFWKSLSLALIAFFAVAGFFLFLYVCFFSVHSSNFIKYTWAEFCIVFSVTTFFVVWIGHILYFNFDWDFRRKCVVCGSKCYVSSMSKFYDSELMESVYMCSNHRIVGVN